MIYTFIRLWGIRIIQDVLLFRKGQEDLSCWIHILTLGMLSLSIVTFMYCCNYDDLYSFTISETIDTSR